jgi:hypothetical protein
MNENLTDKEINYVDYICDMLPKTLKAIQQEQKDGYIYASENRARFDRLRIEITKTLMKIRKEIYR